MCSRKHKVFYIPIKPTKKYFIQKNKTFHLQVQAQVEPHKKEKKPSLSEFPSAKEHIFYSVPLRCTQTI